MCNFYILAPLEHQVYQILNMYGKNIQPYLSSHFAQGSEKMKNIVQYFYTNYYIVILHVLPIN